MITAQDEACHICDSRELHWRESHYFMFYDEAHDLAGFTTMGFQPNEGQCDAGLLLFRRGRLAYLYPKRDVPFAGSWDHWTVGDLRYELVEPLQSWRITLNDKRAQADLTFHGVSPVYDYRDNVDTLPASVATAHYEQAGRVRGTVTIKGQPIQVDAVGHRDHSWGVRDWAGPANWKWITALFDDGAGGLRFALNAWEVLLQGGERTVNGFVFDGQTNHGLAPATRFELEYEGDGRTPRRVALHLVTDDELEYRVTGAPRALFPLAKHDTIINEQMSEFVLEGAGGDACGYGVIETLWQSRGTLESARWLLRGGWNLLRARFASGA